MRRVFLGAVLLALLVGCDHSAGAPDGAMLDGAVSDGSVSTDAASGRDAGPGTDAAPAADAASADAARPDGGALPADAGSPAPGGSAFGPRTFPTDVPGRWMPYHGTVDLLVGDGAVTRAVVVVHGTNRNADDYFDRVVRAAGNAGATNVAVIAPRFVIADDGPGEVDLYWDANGDWKGGDPSSADLAEQVSSFAVLDAMVRALGDRARFPALTDVVVAGHSAGGQVVQRFALGAEADLALPHLHLRYAPANPSSWAYLDAARSVAWSETDFAIPTTSCASYDAWKYGLTDLNPHMAAIGAAAARERYRVRDVVYLLGEDDVDTTDPDLDVTCEAALQGRQRYERGRIFFGAVEAHYGSQPHRLVTVPGVAHSSSRMFDSEGGRATLFGP